MLNVKNIHFAQVIIVAFGVAVLGLFGVVYATHNHSQSAHDQSVVKVDTTCTTVKSTIDVTFADSKVQPAIVPAHLCDKLIFHNSERHSIEIAFGPHAHHQEYPGLGNDDPIGPGGTKELILTAKGQFAVHNHEDELQRATLSVSE